MSRSKVSSLLMLKYGKPIAWTFAIFALPMAAGAVFIDLRWVVCLLMLVFIIVPMALSLLYFNHALLPLTASNAANHRLRFLKSSIEVIIATPDNFPEPEDASNPLQKEKNIIRILPSSSFSSLQADFGGAVLNCKKPDCGFLWIPENAFKSPGDFRKALDIIANTIQQNDNASA